LLADAIVDADTDTARIIEILDIDQSFWYYAIGNGHAACVW
jgi:hypothetical protein